MSGQGIRRLLAFGMTGLMTATSGIATAASDLNGLDANHDGQISREEAAAAQKKAFQRLDSNHDGQLSGAEFVAGQPALPKDAKQAERNRQDDRLHRWFDHIDSDGNEYISEDEYLHAVAPYFDRLDDDHNGMLDAEELQRAVGKPAASDTHN